MTKDYNKDKEIINMSSKYEPEFKHKIVNFIWRKDDHYVVLQLNTESQKHLLQTGVMGSTKNAKPKAKKENLFLKKRQHSSRRKTVKGLPVYR